MSPRERRLTADFESMERLTAEAPDRYSFESTGTPPEQYSIALAVPGLALGMDGLPVHRGEHRFDAYLHRDYPRHAPLLQWRTPIFHPNILPPSRNGGVCIGAWSPSEGLSDLCRRIARLVGFESFSLADPLDPVAAEWATNNAVQMGVDLRGLASVA